MSSPPERDAIGDALLAAYDAAGLVPLPSAGDAAFDVDAAYAISDQLMRCRIARGERRLGWKIGFTNRGIWERYGVHEPIWGPVWSGTLVDIGDELASGGAATVSLAGLSQPRLEPEVMFGFAHAPETGMSEAELARCIEWVAHGFEIVHTHFDGWRFTLPDCVADFALHGRLLVGRRVPLAAFEEPARELAALVVELHEGGERGAGGRMVERGEASIVLGGPLTALRLWVDAMAAREPRWQVAAGDIVSTGTITDAAPIAPGQRWHTTLSDSRLRGVAIRTTA